MNISIVRIIRGDTIKDKRRIFILYYYSIERGADEEQAFDKKNATLHRELLSGNPVEAHATAYAKYFIIKETPKRGRQVTFNDDAIKATSKNIGDFALITNEKMDVFTAFHLVQNEGCC